jgi:2-methylcitrate dehydratase PrpD
MGAVADGARAVDAAAHGYQGDPALLDGPWLKNAVGVEADVGALVDDLSRPIAWEGLGMKPLSTARQALAPVQALNELIAEGLDPACIDTVEVFAPQAFAAMISRPLEPLRSSGYVHVGFQMALAALKPSALFELDRSDVMTDRTLRAFADRVRVVADPALDALYPEAWPAEICVCAGGRELRRRVDVAHGDASNPLSADEVRAKSRSLLRPLMTAAEAETTIAVFEKAFETDNAFATAAFCMREALVPPASG